MLRIVMPIGGGDADTVLTTAVVDDMQRSGRVIDARRLSEDEARRIVPGLGYHAVLEHPRLPVISYPYEWPFRALRDAALFHLRLHQDLLAADLTLTDASAYNVQFSGTRPIHIDFLALRPYRLGEYWLAHSQFCMQFLNPLLLHARCNVPPQAWYRGNLEGIPTEALAQLLPWRARLSLALLTHVFLPARMQRRQGDHTGAGAVPAQLSRSLPKSAYLQLLRQLAATIERTTLGGDTFTLWEGYGAEPGYTAEDSAAKRAFVTGHVSTTRPRLLIDLGCNTGYYMELALAAGAGHVVAIDSDHGAADEAYLRATTKKLAANVLLVDLANESPSQGWRQTERFGLSRRFNADGVLALALVHHLALGRNIPLPEAVAWIMDQAPRGVIEFPQADDPQVKRLVRFKPELLARYDEAIFRDAVTRKGRIVREMRLPASGRLLIDFSTV